MHPRHKSLMAALGSRALWLTLSTMAFSSCSDIGDVETEAPTDVPYGPGAGGAPAHDDLGAGGYAPTPTTKLGPTKPDDSSQSDPSASTPTGDDESSDTDEADRLDGGTPPVTPTPKSDGPQSMDAAPPDTPTTNPEPEGPLLSRPSRCTSIDLSEDDSVVAAVNTDANSVTFFSGVNGAQLSTVHVGEQPSAIVVHPTGKTAFVVNRGSRTVVRIDDIDKTKPRITAELEVGAEPVCGALSPDGSTLFVTEWAEGNIAVIDTAKLSLAQLIDSPYNPYGLTVTGELILATEFFGDLAKDEAALGEDTMFEAGVVRVFEPTNGDTNVAGAHFEETDPITFAARDSTFPDPLLDDTNTTVGPNQLHSVMLNAGKVYVTATGTAPFGPPRFNGNVFPMIYVADLEKREEDTGALGTQNLARMVADNMAEEDRNFAADLLAIDFVPDTAVGYAVSRGGDIVQRLRFDGDGVEFGSKATGVQQIGLSSGGSSCQAPTGIATFHAGGGAWVNCFASFNIARLDFETQSTKAIFDSDEPNTSDAINRGRRFFHTGLNRWSSQAWSSCASCHPNGLSDNVTYRFPAGPRQSTELGSSFLYENGAVVQRIFNWTGIFDEIHDFAANTTLVQGGARPLFEGADDGCAGNTVGFTAGSDFPGGLDTPMQDVEEGSCTPDDFDDMQAYVASIRPARGLVRQDRDAVQRGREAFETGGCQNCHGGSRTTLSRLFFEPSEEVNTALASTPFAPPSGWLPGWSSNRESQIQVQDPNGATKQGPAQVSCVIRQVGTFGVGSDRELSDGIELRNDNTTRAQGEGGYNIPSLYGLAVGAPYLHHGGAATLEDLFSSSAFEAHWQAASANFLTGPNADQQRSDLIKYLLALDYYTPSTHPPAPDPYMDGCPSHFEVESPTPNTDP